MRMKHRGRQEPEDPRNSVSSKGVAGRGDTEEEREKTRVARSKITFAMETAEDKLREGADME